MISHSAPHSSSSSHCSSSKSNKSIWSKIGKLFHRSHSDDSDFSRQTTGNFSNTTLSDASLNTMESVDVDSHSSHRRHRKQLIVSDNTSNNLMIPPFSPTYCKDNEFPYSNFYVKLPDGRWMIRYRDGNRDILRTDIMEGYMI